MPTVPSHSIQPNDLTDMQRHIDAASQCLDALIAGFHQSPQKVNTLLDGAMHQMEISCVAIRQICERVRPRISKMKPGSANYHSKEVYGEVTLTDYGWLHIKLNTLLPHYKVTGGTEYVSDSIIRLLDAFKSDGGALPYFDEAFLAIIDHCDDRSCDVFDHDNKGYKAVQNALKGRLFPDDNQFHLSLGLFTENDPEPSCHIYVLPDCEAGDFMYFRAGNGL